MTAPRAEVFFLPAPRGEQRLCLYHASSGTPKSRLLFIHPFAEEMNKSRRMVALACRALAEAGHAVLQIDLRGCGDSSADFGDASWSDWQDDVRLGLDWLDARTPDVPLWLWGLRVGALIAAQDWHRPVNFLFWQPTVNGKLALQQFLRLRLAAEMAAGGGKQLMATLRQDIAAGRPVQVAGYSLSAALAAGLEASALQPQGSAGRVEWLEVCSHGEAALMPASAQVVQAWREAGWQVRTAAANGPSFWAASEIEVAPAFIAATLAALPLEQPKT